MSLPVRRSRSDRRTGKLTRIAEIHTMSMLSCICGEVITDNTDHLPYKGCLFADTGFFDLFDRISADVAASSSHVSLAQSASGLLHTSETIRP